MRGFWICLLLTGCPEPVDEPTIQTDDGAAGAGDASGSTAAGEMSSPPLEGGAADNGAPTTPGDIAPGEDAEGQVTPPSGTMDVAAAPPTLGTFAGNLPDGELKPAYTQEELAAGATISGTLICDGCSGKLLVRALPPPPTSPTAGVPGSNLQLITQASFDGVGAYEMKVPDGEPVVLQVVDDANSDGFPSQGERMGMRAGGPILAEGSMDGVDLTVGVFPDMPVINAGAPGDMVGEPNPEGAPPADGAPPAGGPPAGDPSTGG